MLYFVRIILFRLQSFRIFQAENRCREALREAEEYRAKSEEHAMKVFRHRVRARASGEKGTATSTAGGWKGGEAITPLAHRLLQPHPPYGGPILQPCRAAHISHAAID